MSGTDLRELRFTFGRAATTVVVRRGAIAELGALLGSRTGPAAPSRLVLVSDAHVAALYGDAALGSLPPCAGGAALSFVVEPGEQAKSFENAGRLCRFLAENEVGRDALLIALGGGVVSDLAGFVAATWMRGISWAVCPTTLEAQIDAAIGGKTAVNIPGAKNLVGAFHHPALVLVDPDSLQTLPDRDLRAGLAESVKHAAVFSPEFLAWHEQNAAAILDRDPGVFGELIERNIRLKGEAVARDPEERTGHRMLLNFGHTIGHAIEQAVAFRLRHGECVALGMLAAACISVESGLLDRSDQTRLTSLLRRLGLPVRLADPPPIEQILNALRADKKSRGGRVRFVLLQGFGETVIREDIREELIRSVCERLVEGAEEP